MQLKLENIEMNNVNTDVTETSVTAFINDVGNITVTNPYVSWNSDNNNGNGETKNNSVKEQTDSTYKAVGKEISTSYMPVLIYICENAAWFLMILLVVIVMLISMTVHYTRPPTVTVNIPSSNTFDEETFRLVIIFVTYVLCMYYIPCSVIK